MSKLIQVLLFSTLLFSCATADMVKVTVIGKTYTPSPVNDVKVYIGANTIRKEYDQIAIINADDEGWAKPDSELIVEMKKRAAQIGADGIIIQSQDSQSAGGIFVGGVYVQSNKKIFKAIAIKYISTK